MEKAMLKTDQIRKESLPQQMVTPPSPSNESAKPVDTIEKPLTIPIHSDVSAPTEIIEINDEAGLKLQAISWSANVNKRIVVINGQICREGERVNGYIVKQINPSDVIVSNESTSGKLSFKIR
jgi:hypothetical protein